MYWRTERATAPIEVSKYFCSSESTSFKSVPFDPPLMKPPFLDQSSYCLTIAPIELKVIFKPVSSIFFLPVPNAAFARPPTTPPIAAPSGPPTIKPMAAPAAGANIGFVSPMPLPSLIMVPIAMPAPAPANADAAEPMLPDAITRFAPASAIKPPASPADAIKETPKSLAAEATVEPKEAKPPVTIW